nr:hypothetical protein [Tanacetum cinerariifolium]
MATTIEQQVALDEALIPSTQRLKTGRSNFRLPSDIQSKESTLQIIYDVLRRCPFFKAFLVTADVPEIYMIPGQSFDELPFEVKILEFLRFLGHSAQIRTLTDEDFVYQVEHKNHKKSNKMYYPGFTKVIIHHFMSKDLSIPRRNKVNWHYVRDDIIFSTIKVVSRHQNTQQYGAILPIELTNEEIRNIKAYKEHYACATGEAAPKPKASARRKGSGSDSFTTPPNAVASPRPTIAATPKLTAAAKGKQPAKATKAKSLSALSEVAMTKAEQLKLALKRSRQQTHISLSGGSGTDEGTDSKPGVPDVPSDDSDKEISWNSSDDEDIDAQEQDKHDDEGDETDESYDGEEDDGDDKDGDESDDDDDDDDDEEEIAKIDEHDDTERGEDDEESENDEEGDDEETREEESFDLIPRTPEDSEDDGNDEKDQGFKDGVESIFATASSSVAPLPTSTPTLTMTPSILTTIITASHAPIPPTPIPSVVLQNLPTFDSMFRFDERLKSLEANFSEYRQTNPFDEAVSNISGIVHQYMNQQMNETVRVAVQIKTDRLRDSYQRENDEFLRTIDDNMKRIIKKQVKSQVKEQVSKILPRIEQSMNAQLEAEVLTRSSHSSRTSYAIAADLSETELKKILIEKIEGNKSIQRSDEQRNLYKALVEAYESDKIILDTYGERVILKRRRDDDDDQGEGPSAGSDRGSKRQREGKEHESASAPLESATRRAGRFTIGSKSRQASAIESTFVEEPVQTTSQIEEPSHSVFETGAEDQPMVQSSQHTEWFSQSKKPPTPDRDWNKTLPATQGSTQTWISDLANLTELEYHLEEVYKATTDQLDWVNPEGDFKRLRLQDIEDMLLLLVQGKLSNLTVEEHFAFNVSLRMFTRSIVIQRRVKILQLGVKSYQNRLNLTKPDTYRSDLKGRKAYTAYSNPRGFIYQNKDKKNRLMRIDELHKFIDGTLNDVRNALDDRLKGIKMQYLP